MKPKALPLAALSSVLLCGCMAFNVGEPQKWTIDRGDQGKVVVTRQRRMSVGFVPALAENHCRPPESVKPIVGWDHDGQGHYTRDRREPILRYAMYGLFTTPWSLLVTPWYGDYACDSHHWQNNNAELISLFPSDAQSEIHVKTWRDGDRKWGVRSGFSHSSIFGFHRYATVVVEEKDAGDEDD